MKAAATSEADATPKLIAICCPVLAMVLAMLVSLSAMSAYTSVFILVYCRDEKKPKKKAWSTMSHTQEAGLDGRVAQADLIKQRKKKRHSTYAQARNEPTDDRDTESSDAK